MNSRLWKTLWESFPEGTDRYRKPDPYVALRRGRGNFRKCPKGFQFPPEPGCHAPSGSEIIASRGLPIAFPHGVGSDHQNEQPANTGLINLNGKAA